MGEFHGVKTFEQRQRVDSLRAERRRIIFERDGGCCVWCGHEFSDYLDPKITLDHIIPRFKNGSWWWENLMLSCGKCNSRRGHIGAKAWRHECKKRNLNANRDHIAKLIRNASSNPLCYRRHYDRRAVAFRFGVIGLEEFLAPNGKTCYTA